VCVRERVCVRDRGHEADLGGREEEVRRKGGGKGVCHHELRPPPTRGRGRTPSSERREAGSVRAEQHTAGGWPRRVTGDDKEPR
jgi:hypothetical protein